MTIYYRDEGGIVREDIYYDDSGDQNSIDFADGYAYYTSACIDDNMNHIERKILIENILRIEF